MSAMLQSRLLRVLQEREVRRVGENTPIYVNVRVVAASNEPLEKRIKEGTFREDLYYRLNVIAIPLPSLRERRDDIPLLVAHFLKGKLTARHEPADAGDPPGDGGPVRSRLAGQCAGAGKRHRAGRDVVRGRHHSGRRPAAAACWPASRPPVRRRMRRLPPRLPAVPESALYPLHPRGADAGSRTGRGTSASEEPVLPMKSLLAAAGAGPSQPRDPAMRRRTRNRRPCCSASASRPCIGGCARGKRGVVAGTRAVFFAFFALASLLLCRPVAGVAAAR